MKRNAFIIAALEQLTEAQPEGFQPGQDVSQVAIAEKPDGPGVGQAAQPPVTETNIDSTTDAVAELMERNTQLATENAELQAEVFDNDADIIAEASDSVQEDLAEAVAVGAALEQLAHLCDLTVKSGQANQASVAGLAFGLEQITDRIGMRSPIAALEAEGDTTPEGQATSIGQKAKDLGANLLQRLVEGVKRVIAWIKEFFKRIMVRTKKVAEEAKALSASLGNLNPNVKVENQGLITRMRLVQNGGSPVDQLDAYTKLAGPALFDFFGKTFEERVRDIHNQMARNKGGTGDLTFNEIKNLATSAQKAIFPERGEKADATSGLSEGAGVWLTPECVGGTRLYMAYDPADKGMFFKTGKAMKESPVQTEGPLPGLNKEDAKRILAIIDHWMDHHRELEKRISRIEYLGKGPTVREWHGEVQYVSSFLKIFAGLGTGTMGGLVTLNLNNCLNYMDYVKECIRLSGAPAAAAA